MTFLQKRSQENGWKFLGVVDKIIFEEIDIWIIIKILLSNN
jgi:hypothetical protein